MTLQAGTVSVDEDSGEATYYDDDGIETTDDTASKLLYLRVISDSATSMKPSTSITPATASFDPETGIVTTTPGTVTQTKVPVGEPSAQAKQEHAKFANTFAAWVVSDLIPLLRVTTTIGTTSAFDGLQKASGTPTTHPDTPVSLTGTIA